MVFKGMGLLYLSGPILKSKKKIDETYSSILSDRILRQIGNVIVDSACLQTQNT